MRCSSASVLACWDYTERLTVPHEIENRYILTKTKIIVKQLRYNYSIFIYLLPIIYYPLPITYYLLPITDSQIKTPLKKQRS